MIKGLTLSPRYNLDDINNPWLKGIDPTGNYWIDVNSSNNVVRIPGLMASSLEDWKKAMVNFRNLNPQESMEIERISGESRIYCISNNCYAIEAEVSGNLVWHLFDSETTESLLMTSHPDWQPSSSDLELGREMISRWFQQPAYCA